MYRDRLNTWRGFIRARAVARRGVIGALALLAACGAPSDDATVATDPASWTMRLQGLGPIVAGMRVEDVARRVPGSFELPVGAVANACTYAVWDAAPAGVRVMVEDGAVTRVDVLRGRTIATEEGARIGDSEARIDSLYEGRVERRPHKYTDGAYLIVRADTARPLPEVTEPGATPPNTRSDFRLVFETDGARVTQYRAGLFPAVEYVEGCG